jgi:hypothetical protein
MSFGFGTTHPEIQKAIQTAASPSDNNMLMFAAASNRGHAYEPTFPAREHCVMCIYAADGNGNKSEINAQTRSRETRFSTVGIAVLSAWPEQPANLNVITARKSGTSFATPIAAGIAACILEFAIQQNMARDKYEQLKTIRVMNNVFKLMTTESDGLDFIYPWELFHRPFKNETIIDLIEREIAR